MASRTSKKYKAADLSTSWSDWKFDETRVSYYQVRKNGDGQWEYFYDRERREAPRTLTSHDGNVFGQSSSLEPDAAYYNDPVDDLSADFAGLKSASKYTIDSTLESSAVTALSDAPENANKTVYDSKLDPRFEIISSPSRFFKKGRVFKTLWTEPAGNISEFDGEFVTAASFGEKAYSKMRYFVVVREMHACCLCLPLNTYNFRGTGKERIRIEDYAAVYPSGGKPATQNDETLMKDSFPIIIENPQERLNPISRLNFGRVYTVEHNVKVLKVGRIPDESLPMLDRYFVERITGSTLAELSPGEGRGRSLQDPSVPNAASMSEHEGDALSLGSGAHTSRPSDEASPHHLQLSLSYEASQYPIKPVSRSLTPQGSSYIPEPSPYSSPPPSSGSQLSGNSFLPSTATGMVQTSSDYQKGSGQIIPKEIHRVIIGTKGELEKLDPRFKVHSSRYFQPGEVFKVLWFEPRGNISSALRLDDSTSILEGPPQGAPSSKFGEQPFSAIRRFVIVAGDHGHCQCVPILTSQHRGTSIRGVKPDDHAIIYTGDYPPQLTPGEGTLSKAAIKVIPKTPRDRLDPASRINYAKIYTVEHNVKVLFIGRIADSDRFIFNTDFDATWAAKRSMSRVKDMTAKA